MKGRLFAVFFAPFVSCSWDPITSSLTKSRIVGPHGVASQGSSFGSLVLVCLTTVAMLGALFGRRRSSERGDE